MSSPLHPADRLRNIGVSEILKIARLANDLKRAGHDVIDLSLGEPDFNTPDHVLGAADRAMRSGATKYTELDGCRQLKEAIQQKFQRDNGLHYDLDEIIVSAGAKQVIFNAMMATLNPGDEVLVPAPYWTSYIDMVSIAGGIARVIPCPEQRGFLLSPESLEAAITARTRWIILNSPSNPTGAVYSRQEYRHLISVLERYPDVWILADDIYEHLVYDDTGFVTPAAMGDAVRRTLVVNGVSKAYAMTGWRIGYGAGPVALIKAMLAVQSQATSCPCSVSQAAAIAALNGPQDVVRSRCGEFQIRRDRVIESLETVEGISCRPPSGAFYAFAGCRDLIGARTGDGQTISSDVELAKHLLRVANVAVVPGSAFGMSPYLRLSFAASIDQLEEACRRIKYACSELDISRSACLEPG